MVSLRLYLCRRKGRLWGVVKVSLVTIVKVRRVYHVGLWSIPHSTTKPTLRTQGLKVRLRVSVYNSWPGSLSALPGNKETWIKRQLWKVNNICFISMHGFKQYIKRWGVYVCVCVLLVFVEAFLYCTVVWLTGSSWVVKNSENMPLARWPA